MSAQVPRNIQRHCTWCGSDPLPGAPFCNAECEDACRIANTEHAEEPEPYTAEERRRDLIWEGLLP